jgi:formylglycine-generating enzyme required for sulfatase activity
MGALPAGIDAKNEGAAKPVSNITYVDLVGAAQDAQKYGWPYSSKVAEESFVGRLRAKTTLPAGFAAGYKFYLPTDAQWEYACRGGVETTWPNGTSFTAGSLKTKPQVAGYAGQYDDNLNRFAWHRANSNDRAQIVGTRCPNAFGVYDLLGNVSEWGLCYSLASPCPGGVEPTGDRSYAASTAPLRSLRGGNFASFVFSASTYTKYQQTNLQMDPASAGNYGLLSQRPAFHVRATWDFKHDFVGARLALVHTSVKE